MQWLCLQTDLDKENYHLYTGGLVLLSKFGFVYFPGFNSTTERSSLDKCILLKHTTAVRKLAVTFNCT